MECSEKKKVGAALVSRYFLMCVAAAGNVTPTTIIGSSRQKVQVPFYLNDRKKKKREF